MSTEFPLYSLMWTLGLLCHQLLTDGSLPVPHVKVGDGGGRDGDRVGDGGGDAGGDAGGS